MKGIRLLALVLVISIFLGCFQTALAYNNFEEKAYDKYFTIRVKLTSLGSITSLNLTTKGDYKLSQNNTNVSDTSISITVVSNTLQVTVNGQAVYSGQQVTLSRNNILKEAGDVTLAANSRKYLGDLNFYCESGNIVVVNHLPMAYYLYGVLAAEMNNSYPLEALKSQAVAAKCYAMKRMKPKENYDIRDQSTDQAYKGYNATWTNIFNAVDSSIANIVTYKGDLITTYYSSTNGGETNYPSYQWNGDSQLNNGYAVSIDSYDFSNSNSRMEKVSIALGSQTMSNEIKLMLKDMTKTLLGTEPVDITSIDDIFLHTPKFSNLQRNMTNVTVKFVAKMSAEPEELISLELIFPVSKLLSYGVFKDSSLSVYWGEKIGDKYNIYHVRWGHGVGLSQRGAQARALDGHTFKDILQFYFPTAEMSLMDIQVPTDVPTIEPPKPLPPVTEDASSGAIKIGGETKPAKKGKTTSPSLSFPGNTPILQPRYEVIEKGYVTGSQVNMRSGPSTKFIIIAKLEQGTKLDILDMSNPSWYRVKVGDLFGYISSQYVGIEDESPKPAYDSY
ncbi:MAG: SpoIID/LytB domain-containing protein, partial [Clostridiales bacterium]|nr:SpoIID/LytB domain-containing protein [Clostridiales bacterium]